MMGADGRLAKEACKKSCAGIERPDDDERSVDYNYDSDTPVGFANEDGDDGRGPCRGGGDTDNVRVFRKGQERSLEEFLEDSGERIAVLEGELDFSGDMFKVRGDITIEGKNCKVKNGGFSIISKMNIIIRNIELL